MRRESHTIRVVECDLDGLLQSGRGGLVWEFVERLDMTTSTRASRRAKGMRGGRDRSKLLLALWLYATIDGVGSDREVDRLCEEQEDYSWLRGGV